MAKEQESAGRFNLITGEDTYSGAYAQNPNTSRRIQSLIPLVNGELVRELGEPLFLPTVLPSKVGALYQYDYNDSTGNQHSTQFAATATQLFQNISGAWVAVSLPMLTGLTNSANPLVDYPSFVNINNLLHFSDGTNNWIYDGPNNAFVRDGFDFYPNIPDVDASSAGSLSCLINIYYWCNFADETSGRVHEGTTSGISVGTGAITNKSIKVYPGLRGGLDTTIGSPTVNTHGGLAGFTIQEPGYHLYVAGVDYGPILQINSSSQLTLVNNAPATNSGALFIIAPARATNIHVYRSEIDGSKLGQFLASIPILGNANPFITDQSPFINQPNTTMLNIDRPIRNDIPPTSKVMEVHKYRLWRRRETIPNRFNFTAYEEVLSGNNGSPQESAPGTFSGTISDIINETAYPRTAAAIRALKSHNDALYIGTEKEILPLWGDTIGAFALSEVTAIDGGVISRWGMESLSHGLSIFSYDRKLYIYPPVSPIWALTPQDLNVTDQLVEIGRPMRNKFLKILSSDIQNVRTLKYRYNMRDWLVVCYQDTSNVYHTYVYDFETKGWFELQRGFVSIAVFETAPGIKILVGGGTDGKVYVADDVTGAITPNPTLPLALLRTALIDFGQPDILHEPDYLEVEVSNPALIDSSTTINFYLDPTDADNPGTPISLNLAPVQGETNRYRAFFSAANGGMGVLCKRLMIELNLTSDTNTGSFRSLVLKADPVTNMMR